MSVVPIIFLGTPEFARFHLESLIHDEHFQVVGVVTQPDRPSGRHLKLTPSSVKELALERGLPVIDPPTIKNAQVLETVESWRAEAAVVVAYGQILNQEFLDLFPKKVVNIHASLLPRWRGAAPIQRALMEGDSETGVALQVMVKKLDAGDILGARHLPLTDQMDAREVHDRLKVLGANLLQVEFMDYLRGHLVPQRQEESLVTYAPKIEKSESAIDWSWSARKIFNRMRGLALGPGITTLKDGKVLKIIKAHPAESLSGRAAGEVVEVGVDFFVVACGQGALRIEEVQPESRARMKVSDYLRGYAVQVGERFGG